MTEGTEVPSGDCFARVRRKSLFEGLPRLLDRSDGLARAPKPWTTAQDVRHRSRTTRRLPRLLATTCAVAACAALTGCGISDPMADQAYAP